jgi:flavodoxin
MKTLIVYYTRTGTTKKLVEALGKKLGADIELLNDPADYSGAIGYMKAGRAAMKKATVDIGEAKYNPEYYDLVIIGSPVWVGVCTPAVRTYIEKYQDKFKSLALFSTQGSKQEQKIFNDLKLILKNEPMVTEFFTTKEVRHDNYNEKLEKLIEELQKAF